MIEFVCPKCNVPMKTNVCTKDNCGCATVSTTTIYWCRNCNTPIFNKVCDLCGDKGEYLATDLRPVFPEEKILLAILLKKESPLCYEESSIWFGSNQYFINGNSIRLPLTKINNYSFDKITGIKADYDKYVAKCDYGKFNNMVDVFIKANKNRYDETNEEAVNYILRYKEKYSINDMFVSFSGGKDSTVTSHLVTKALGTNKILHIFGDTTLEFPMTYEYKKRFVKNEETMGIQVLTAKNREKDFYQLCDIIGPPSRVMRWCCTVFKTGAISRTIESAFKDKTNVLTFYGIRRSESTSRKKYSRESKSPKISKQNTVSPIINWIDFDVWLYILTTRIDFNDAYKLGFSRVGCWCCPNNGQWSEFLAKIHMFDQFVAWHNQLVAFAIKIGKPDPEKYVNAGNWKARQGGNGLEMAQKSIVAFEPCATEENTFNYELQENITDDLYELFKPFGWLNNELGNHRIGEVYILDRVGIPIIKLKGRKGSNILKVTIYKPLLECKNIISSEKKIQCQITKFQMCINCKACEGVCKHGAISISEKEGKLEYCIDDQKCIRCGECVSHFNAGCYIRKVLTIKRG